MAINVTMSRTGINLPRIALSADGIVCSASGVLLLAGARPINGFLGLDSPLGLGVLGALLIPYGAWLLWAANRRPVERGLLRTVALANAAWVLGSAVILLINRPALTLGGRWAVAAVAAVVALLALVQAGALRRMR